MIRSANSFIVKEMEDCSASIFDAQGQLLAEEAGPPIQLNTVGVCLKTILAHYFPLEAWQPGDVIITNDPYAGDGSLAATHTNDYLAFHPLFHEGELVAFSGLMVHHFDIGGMNMGTRGWGTEIYQEGLRIPPLKIIEAGELDGKVLDIILTNTRTREMLENDLMSQISSVKVAADDVLELFRKYGSATMQACFAELIDYSERRTREALAAIPDGVYRHEEPLLDDGAKGGPYWLRARAHQVAADSVTLDFTGTDAQVKGPINSPLATTLAAVYYVMRCVTDASIPSTEGCKRPITIIAPPGTLVNARSARGRVPADDRVPLDRRSRDGRARAGDARARDGRLVRMPLQLHDRHAARRRAGARCSAKSCPAASAPRRAPTASRSSPATSPTATSRRPRRSRWNRRCSTSAARCASTPAAPGTFRGGVGQVLTYRILGDSPELQHTSQKSVSLPQGVAGGTPGRRRPLDHQRSRSPASIGSSTRSATSSRCAKATRSRTTRRAAAATAIRCGATRRRSRATCASASCRRKRRCATTACASIPPRFEVDGARSLTHQHRPRSIA